MARLGRLELPAYRFEASHLRGISNLENVGVAWRDNEITTDKCLAQPSEPARFAFAVQLCYDGKP